MSYTVNTLRNMTRSCEMMRDRVKAVVFKPDERKVLDVTFGPTAAAELVRKTRFSYGSVLLAVLVAALIQIIIPFPQPWGMIIAGCMAVSIQLGTRWIDSRERLNVESNPATPIA